MRERVRYGVRVRARVRYGVRVRVRMRVRVNLAAARCGRRAEAEHLAGGAW